MKWFVTNDSIFGLNTGTVFWYCKKCLKDQIRSKTNTEIYKKILCLVLCRTLFFVANHSFCFVYFDTNRFKLYFYVKLMFTHKKQIKFSRLNYLLWIFKIRSKKTHLKLINTGSSKNLKRQRQTKKNIFSWLSSWGR